MALYDNLKNLIAGGTLFADAPVGVINAFGGTTAPDGWLLCQGQAISRTDYADLFAVIGTAFGSGDGSTTFNLPDLRGEFLRGAGTNSHANQGNGGAVGEHQDATEFTPSRSGDAFVDAYNLGDYSSFINSDVEYQKSLVGYSRVTAQQYTGGIAQTMVPRPTNTSVNFIIKAVQIALPADLQAAIEDMNLITYGG